MGTDTGRYTSVQIYNQAHMRIYKQTCAHARAPGAMFAQLIFMFPSGCQKYPEWCLLPEVSWLVGRLLESSLSLHLCCVEWRSLLWCRSIDKAALGTNTETCKVPEPIKLREGEVQLSPGRRESKQMNKLDTFARSEVRSWSRHFQVQLFREPAGAQCCRCADMCV